MNHLLADSLEQNEEDRLEIKETQQKKWRIFVYILIVIKIILCIVVLSLDSYLAINGLGSTKKYLGFCQTIIGILIAIILTVSIFFCFKTLLLAYIISANVLSIACGVMFILLDLSADIQYYDGQAPLQPAHTKLFFRIYKAYYIFSLTLACFTIVSTIFVYKVRSNIHSSDDSSEYINVVTRHSSSKMIKENLMSKSEKMINEDGPLKEERAQTNNAIKGINIGIGGGSENKIKNSYEAPELTRKKLDDFEKNRDENDDKTKLAIDINESQEKSFHNSPQSSKKIKLPNSHAPLNSILIDDRSAEENKPIQMKTMISEMNRQGIESFLMDTPSEPKAGLNLQE